MDSRDDHKINYNGTVGRDLANRRIPISELRWYGELSLSADLHASNVIVPTFDNVVIAYANGVWSRLVVLDRSPIT